MEIYAHPTRRWQCGVALLLCVTAKQQSPLRRQVEAEHVLLQGMQLEAAVLHTNLL